MISKKLLTFPHHLTLPTKALSLLALFAVLLGTATAHSLRTLRANRTSAVYTVTATAYEAVANQTDSRPLITADNSRIPKSYGSHMRWLALSRDLLRPWGGPFEFGDKVRVRGISPALDGVYTVHDTMNRRYRHCLDVLVHPREHVTIACSGVKIRRISPTKPWSNTSLLLISLRTSRNKKAVQRHTRLHQAVAPRAARSSRRGQPASLAATPHPAKRIDWQSRRMKRGPRLTHQTHDVAKRQLATLPKRTKKRVAAHGLHLPAA